MIVIGISTFTYYIFIYGGSVKYFIFVTNIAVRGRPPPPSEFYNTDAWGLHTPHPN